MFKLTLVLAVIANYVLSCLVHNCKC